MRRKRSILSAGNSGMRSMTSAGDKSGILKGGALATLILQNSALALVMRYTRVSGKQADKYIPTTAVVMAEIFKVVVALVMQFKTDGSVGAVINSVRMNTVGQPGQYLKMGILALLYTLQNNLAYVAAEHLDGPTYQIICQSKIPITALLSVIILGKALSIRQWISLMALTFGVGLVQICGSESTDKSPVGLRDSSNLAVNDVSTGSVRNACRCFPASQGSSNTFVGFASAISLCFCSGLAGVFFELMLKGSSTASLWMRNIQLGSFSLFLGLLAVVFKDGAAVANRGYFSGYSPMVWLCISLHSLGGLAVAMVVKYADNVVKCFATSVSIVLSCILSIAFLGMQLSQGFTVGALMVMSATYGYNTKPTEPKAGGPANDRLLATDDHVAKAVLEPKENV